MSKHKLLLHSFLSSLGVLIYISGVAWLMFNAERFFGKINSFTGPVAMLLLFIVSALVTGSLVLGRPILLYFNGSKKTALQLFFLTAAWLVIFTIVIFLILKLKI